MEKTVNINNFIGVYDGYITKSECDKAIKIFEDQDKFNKTVNRLEFENMPILQKQDQQFFAMGDNISIWWEDLKGLISNYDLARSTFLHSIKNSKNFTHRRISCLAFRTWIRF